MSKKRTPQGKIRDAIAAYLKGHDGPAKVRDIVKHVLEMYPDSNSSSVRSSLRLRPDFFSVGHGLYVYQEDGE